jgi:rubredoxin
MPKSIYACRNCAYVGKPEIFRRGSLKIEIILWCALIIPGIAYTVWRNMERTPICPKCHYGPMLPTDTNLGYRMSGG